VTTLNFRTREEDERYLARTVDRLRTLRNVVHVESDADPEQTRARLGRMRHGTTPTSLLSRIPA
jgi:hypothetical protein